MRRKSKSLFVMGILLAGLTSLLGGCFTMPQPEASLLETQGILSSEPDNGSINVQLSIVPKINFDTAMDKVATERAITVFKGKYNPAANPATFTTLQLTAMCDGKWRARNPNDFPISFTWDVYKTTEKGVGVVAAKSDAFFYSTKGSKTVRLFVNNKQQQVKASNGTACTDTPYTVTWSNNDKSVSIKPTEAFIENTDYTFVLSTAAKSTTGTALINPYVLSFKTGTQVSGPLLLQPGGSVTGVDGVVVDAAYAQLTESLELSIQKIDNPSTLRPFPYSLPVPVTNYYKITSPKRHYIHPGDLGIYIPYPEGAPKEGLSVAFLVPGPKNTAPDWFFLPATYSPITNEILFSLKRVDPQGLTFVVVKDALISSSTTNLNSQTLMLEAQQTSTPGFKAICSSKFSLPGVTDRCNDSDIAAAKAALEEAYNLYRNTYDYGEPALYRERNPDKTLGDYVIILEPSSTFSSSGLYVSNSKIGQKYGYEVGAVIVAVGSDGVNQDRVGAVFHETNHSFVFGYPSVNGYDLPEEAAMFIEGLASLARDSRTTLQSSGYYEPGGLRLIDVSLLAPYVQNDTSSEGEKRARYPYQVQRFFEWMAKSDPSGEAPTLEYFLKFLETTGDSEIDKLPAWDPHRIDYVLKTKTGFKDGLGEAYQGYIQDILTTATGDVYIDPNLPGIQEVILNGEGKLSTDIAIESLGTKIIKIKVPADKTAQDMLADFNKQKGAKTLLLYSQQGDYLYVVFISSDITPLTPNSPSTTGKFNFEVMEVAGAWSANFGDPHISTPDVNRYSFQAVGDYVLTRSTIPDDTFEIQVRYQPFTTNNHEWSGENALAMMVGTDKVELYVRLGNEVDLYVNGLLTPIQTNGIIPLQKGTISRTQKALNVSWSDGTLLVASLTSPDLSRLVRGFTKIFFPVSRRGKVEGLMGNFDGRSGNDLQIRGGAVLENPTESQLYTGGFRDSWSIARGASQSLFSQGNDPFDPSYPSTQINLSDFPTSDVGNARQVCRDQAIVDAFLLKACTLDVLVTGSPDWAGIIGSVSQGIDLSVPSVTINPPVFVVSMNQVVDFGAIVRGSTSGITWSASSGAITGNGNSISYTTPSQPGIYKLTASLTSDTSVSSEATVIVVGFSRVSVKQDGTEILPAGSNAFVRNASMSSDGRLVAFDLADESGQSSVWLKDLVTGELRQITDSGSISAPSLTSNGRYLTYQSGSPVSSASNVFRLDLETGARSRIDVTDTGANGDNAANFDSSVSDDGRYAVFTSTFSRVDYYGPSNIYLKDTSTGTLQRLDIFENSQEIVSFNPVITPNGRFIAFDSKSIDGIAAGLMADNTIETDAPTSNIVTTGTADYKDIFLFDISNNTLVSVSETADGTLGDSDSFDPSVSADGRFVVFSSAASNLVPNDTNDLTDIFLKDRVSRALTRINTLQDGTEANNGSVNAKISADGRYVVFESYASNLVANDANNGIDVFIKDIVTGKIERIDVNDLFQGDVGSYTPSMSADGKFITFITWASITSDDVNNAPDLFRTSNPLWQ
jgi:von Willebrand factor type D domain/WD40-like Beta Propeller Repeat